MAIIEHDFELSMRDIDKNNELTNLAILSFCEDIGGIHSDIAGFGLNDIEKTRLSWVLLGWKLEVYKRPKYGEKIHLKTWPRDSFRFYTYRDFEVYNESNELVAVATSKWALVNIDSGLAKLEDYILDKYGIEDISVFEERELKKLKEPATHESVYEYTVSRSNIDINNHMHNLYYLSAALETLPEEIYLNSQFNHIEIMYKSSAILGSKLHCLYSVLSDKTSNQINTVHYVTIKSEDEKTLHSIIKFS